MSKPPEPKRKRQAAPQSQVYPKPGPVGGRLIRRVIALFRQFGVQLPITSHILCAVSAGSDSIALALLLSKYGRRVVDPSCLSLLHINHGWRGKESDEDSLFVERFAQRLDLPIQMVRLGGAPTRPGVSWENEARLARKRVFAESLRELPAGSWILTAHHADDLAETLLWRILTGCSETHGGGIVFREGQEMRPFLTIRKKDLQAFLKEEGQSWREDSTNHQGRFLRSQIRQDLSPVVEKLFPKAVEHLVKMGIDAQIKTKGSEGSEKPVSQLLGSLGVRLKRSHWHWVSERMNSFGQWKGEIQLPEGWVLFGETKRIPKNNGQERNREWVERWVLERKKVPKLETKSRT